MEFLIPYIDLGMLVFLTILWGLYPRDPLLIGGLIIGIINLFIGWS